MPKTMRVLFEVTDTGEDRALAHISYAPKIGIAVDVATVFDPLSGAWEVWAAREDGVCWEGRGETQAAAVLDFLRDRLGER
jgi:hypothetical protein